MNKQDNSERLKVGIAQMAPVWLHKRATLDKVLGRMDEAASLEVDLLVFGEGLVPGYPFWVERTEGARFDSDIQKDLFARYAREAVQIASGDLDAVRERAGRYRMAVYLGTIERAEDRSNHSLYCSLVYIDPSGNIGSVHRKLVPTYEERLVWSPGDGHGLRVHKLGPFTLGGLNCWENWMPLARAALYGQGEDVHISVWPGNKANTEELTRFIARESRSYHLAACGLLRPEDVPDDLPHRDLILKDAPPYFGNGGSCIAGPDAAWIIEPVVGEESLLITEIDHRLIRRERQNFDPSGHYARPDVLQLRVKRERQSVLKMDP